MNPIVIQLIYALANLIGQGLEHVSMVLWFHALGTYQDVYWVLLATGVAYCIIFVITLVLYRLYYALSHRRLLPWVISAEHAKRASLVGFYSGLNGLFIIYASPGQRTPPLIQQCLFNCTVIFTVLCNIVLLKHPIRRYMTPRCILALTMVLAGAIISVIPLFTQSSSTSPVVNGTTTVSPSTETTALKESATEEGKWASIFLIGILAGVVYNVMQARFFEWHDDNYFAADEIPRNYLYVQLLLFQSFAMTVFYILLFWTDMISGFGSQDRFSDFFDAGKLIFKSTFTPWGWADYGFAGLFGLSFNGGFLLSFWCGLGMNDFATGFTAIVNQLVPVGASLFFKLVPSANDSDIDMGWEYLLPALALGWVGALVYLTYELKESEEVNVEQLPLVPRKEDEAKQYKKQKNAPKRESTDAGLGGSSWV